MDKKNRCASTNIQLLSIKVDNGGIKMTEEPKPDNDSTKDLFDTLENKKEISNLIEDEETESIELDPLDLEIEGDSSPELVIFFDEEKEKEDTEAVPSELPDQDGPDQKSINESTPTDKSNRITSVSLSTLKQTSTYGISDIQQMLSEIQELEEKENQKQIKSTKSGKLIDPTTTPSKPQKFIPANSDRSEIRHLLIEMNFLEGNELLQSGDRSGAINHLRKAVNYAPNDIKYYLKLAEVLSEDDATLAEAEKCLSIAIAIEPNNMELRSKLFELKESKSGTKRKPSASKKETQPLQPTTLQGGPQVLKAISSAEIATSKQLFVGAEKTPLKTKVSLRNKLIIIAFLTLGVLGLFFGLSRETPRRQVRLLYPANEAIVPLRRLKLNWQGQADLFVIEIRDGKEKIFEKATANTEYIFSPEDRALLKPGTNYTWRVIPKNINGEELPYKIDEFKFSVVSLSNRK